MLPSIFSVLLAAVGVVAHDTGARLTKPPLANNLDYLEKGLEEHLPQTPYTLSKWNNGYIPEECKHIVTGGVFASVKYDANDFDIYDVHYQDCGDPWVFCHHHKSNATIDTMARQFGKIPIQMREWIRHVIDVPADNGWAFEYDGTITFVRPIEGMLSTMIHETGHSLDLNGAYPVPTLSDSDNWWDNYNQDSNVPDPYAQTNAIEDVAQTTVVSVFNENVPGKFASVEPGWQKIFHQYATLITQARNAGNGHTLLTPGEGTACKRRMPSSKPVPKSGNAKRSALGMRPDVSFKSGVAEIDTSHRANKKLTACTLKY